MDINNVNLNNKKEVIKKKPESYGDLLAEFLAAIRKINIKRNGIGRVGGSHTFNYYTVEDVVGAVNKASEETGIDLNIIGISPERELCGNVVYSITIRLGKKGNKAVKYFKFEGFGDTQQKNLIQATGATYTYLTRYAYMALLNLCDELHEPDKNIPREKKERVVKPTPVKEIKIEEVKKSSDDFDWI